MLLAVLIVLGAVVWLICGALSARFHNRYYNWPYDDYADGPPLKFITFMFWPFILVVTVPMLIFNSILEGGISGDEIIRQLRVKVENQQDTISQLHKDIDRIRDEQTLKGIV